MTDVRGAYLPPDTIMRVYRPLFSASIALLLSTAATHLFAAEPVAAAAAQTLKISRIRGKLVTVTVPAGYDSVSLQSVRVKRVGRSKPQKTWGTVDTKFTKGTAGTVTFRLTRLMAKASLRVYGTQSNPLPDSFLSGVSRFGADKLATNNSNGGLTLSGSTNFLSAGSVVGSTSVTPGTNTGTVANTVVESDIWKVAGNRVYFFNQLRGLQVLDVSKPDAPQLLGTLRMPAAGEDLYLLDENHVAVLKKGEAPFSIYGGVINFGSVLTTPISVSGGTLTLTGGTVTLNGGVAMAASAEASSAITSSIQASQKNELVIADVSAGAPTQVATVEFTGSLQESRLVGHILYVAAGTNQTDAVSNSSTYGTRITAFDVSDPTNPVERESVFFPGWSNVVTATPETILITTNNWTSGNVVNIVDIAAGDGTLKVGGSVQTTGYIQDKFKLNVENGVLTTVSQVWNRWFANGSDPNLGTVRSGTEVETFSLKDPANPQALGSLLVGEGETVRATRFDQGRVYVVTFEQVDPLHIVDLSDPANPTLSGVVQAPGFSTYIEPLGDRLVTIGLVNWQPAVSLFDVADPAQPKLLQQLTLTGKNSGWSGSEAVWNEKAFKVLPEQNLILLPVSGMDFEATDTWGGEYFSRVQLIDLFTDKLVKRGAITSGFSPRRADVVNDRIVAISPGKLVTVNAVNRDKPTVTAEVELAWSVDRVYRVGDYLVQIGGSADTGLEAQPTLSVSPGSDPDATLELVDLDPLNVVGSTVKDGVLYLAQKAWPKWWISTAAQSKPQLLVTAYDLSALPKLKKLSQASGAVSVQNWGEFTPLWPSPGTLVWTAAGNYIDPSVYDTANQDSTGGDVLTISIARPIYFGWWGAWTQEFMAYKVGTPEKIAFASKFELSPSEGASIETTQAGAGLVLASEVQYWDPKSTAGSASEVGKHFLRVLDYSEPTAPALRDERVNIPGRLVGLGREGRLLYTQGSDVDLTTGETKDGAALHASAWDGTEVHLVSTLPLPSASAAFAFSGSQIAYVDSQPAYTWAPPGQITLFSSIIGIGSYPWWGSYVENSKLSSLHVLSLTDDGKFTEYGSIEIGHDYGLNLFADLAVTRPDWHSVRLLDLSNAMAPTDLGSVTLPGWIYPQMEHADGGLDSGLAIPVGAYGVETISITK